MFVLVDKMPRYLKFKIRTEFWGAGPRRKIVREQHKLLNTMLEELTRMPNPNGLLQLGPHGVSVASFTRSGVNYAISLENGHIVSCECPRFTAFGDVCKHVLLVEQMTQWRRAPLPIPAFVGVETEDTPEEPDAGATSETTTSSPAPPSPATSSPSPSPSPPGSPTPGPRPAIPRPAVPSSALPLPTSQPVDRAVEVEENKEFYKEVALGQRSGEIMPLGPLRELREHYASVRWLATILLPPNSRVRRQRR